MYERKSTQFFGDIKGYIMQGPTILQRSFVFSQNTLSFTELLLIPN